MAEDRTDVERLNAIGVLTRREIEARVLAPVIDALAREFTRGSIASLCVGSGSRNTRRLA
jgi:hypothetical protein